METLSRLQERLYLFKRDAKFEQAQLVGWTAKFCRLFLIDEGWAQAIFVGTPAQLRAVLDEFLVLAKRCGVNMEMAVWGKYPDICPYCLRKPCSCGPGKAKLHKRLDAPPPQRGLTLGNLQRMLGDIYPNHTSLLQECLDVIEEVTESSLEVWSSKDRRRAEEEFADTFARLIRLANTLGIPLEGMIA